MKILSLLYFSVQMYKIKEGNSFSMLLKKRKWKMENVLYSHIFNIYNFLFGSFCRITLTAQCDMDFHLYPMDIQHCSLIIESCKFSKHGHAARHARTHPHPPTHTPTHPHTHTHFWETSPQELPSPHSHCKRLFHFVFKFEILMEFMRIRTLENCSPRSCNWTSNKHSYLFFLYKT